MERLNELFSNLTTTLANLFSGRNPEPPGGETNDTDNQDDAGDTSTSIKANSVNLRVQTASINSDSLTNTNRPTPLASNEGGGILTAGSRAMFMGLGGVGIGIREAVETFAKLTIKAANAFGDIIGKAARAFGDKVKEFASQILSTQTAQQANERQNLERYIQAQSRSLLMLSTESSKVYAEEVSNTLSQVAIDRGLSRQEVESVGQAMATVPVGIPEMMGMSTSQFTQQLAEMEALAADLGGNRGGQSISKILTDMVSGRLSVQDAVTNFQDPILNRLVDPYQGVSITQNPAADFANLFARFQEISQEIDTDEILRSNPERILRRFQNNLFDENAGLFGYLKEFNISDALRDGETVRTNILTQFNQLLTTIGNFFSKLVVGIANRVAGGVGVKDPAAAVGLILNKITDLIQSIPIDKLLSNFSSIFTYLGEAFSEENLEKASNFAKKVGSFLGGIADFFLGNEDEVQEAKGAARLFFGALGFFFGGLPGLIAGLVGVETDFDIGKMIWGAILGTAGLKIAGNVLSGLMINTFRSWFLGLKGGGSGILEKIFQGFAGGGAGGGILSSVWTKLSSGVNWTTGKIGSAATNFATKLTSSLSKLTTALANTPNGIQATMAALKNFAGSAAGVLVKGLLAKFAVIIGGLSIGAMIGDWINKQFFGRDTGFDKIGTLFDALGEQIKRVTGNFLDLFNATKRRENQERKKFGTTLDSPEERGVNAATVTTREALKESGFEFTKEGEKTVVTQESLAKVLGFTVPQDKETEEKVANVQTNFRGSPNFASTMLSKINTAIETEENNSDNPVFLSAFNTSEFIVSENQMTSMANMVANMTAERSGGVQNTSISKGDMNFNPTLNINVPGGSSASPQAIAQVVMQNLSEYYEQSRSRYYS